MGWTGAEKGRSQLHGLDGGREGTISTTRDGRGQRRGDLNYTGWTGAEKGHACVHTRAVGMKIRIDARQVRS